MTTLFRVNSTSVPLLLPLKLPALPQPGLYLGPDLHPLQLVQRPVQHVHPRPAQLFGPPGPLSGSQPSAPKLQPLKKGRKKGRKGGLGGGKSVIRKKFQRLLRLQWRHSLQTSRHTAGKFFFSLRIVLASPKYFHTQICHCPEHWNIIRFCQRQNFLKS